MTRTPTRPTRFPSAAAKARRPRLAVLPLEDRAVPATLWVDNTPGMAGTQFTASGGNQPASVTGLTPGVNIFSTIGAAVAAASPGDTINVADGTYNELVAVDKSLAIRGNQFGADARTRGAVPESVVSNGDGDFQVLADTVTIDGFKLTGVVNDPRTQPSALGAAIWTNPGFSGTHGGLTAVNNILSGNIAGIELDNDGTYPATVRHNLFRDNTRPGPNGGLDVEVDFGLTNAAIDSNTFTNGSFVEDSWALGVEAPGDHIAFTNNTVANHGRGVFFYLTGNGTVAGNTITGATHYAVGLFGGDAGFQVMNNDLSNSARGLDIEDQLGGSPNSGVVAECNNFAGDGVFGVGIVDDGVGNGYSGTLDVSPNWWGNITGPTAAGNPGGTGSKIQNDFNDPVVFSPWAASADCSVTTTGAPGAGLQADPCAAGQNALVVFGTAGDDRIEVERKDHSNLIEVEIDGKGTKFDQFFNAATFDRIIVFGLAGDDHIEVDNKIVLPAMIFGGDGDDHIQAGGGPTVEVGGAGNDHLEGGPANDILIGGTGKDHLEGKGGNDILIAGTTAYDGDVTGLCTIMDVWRNTTNANYAAQVNLLKTGPYKLDATTVRDDGAGNKLDGGPALDWYFANVDGVGNNGVKDKVTGPKPGEVVTRITL